MWQLPPPTPPRRGSLVLAAGAASDAGLGPRRGRRRAALHLLLERVHLVLQLQVLGLDALQLELELAVRLLISSGHHLHGSIDRKNEEAISSSSSSSQGD